MLDILSKYETLYFLLNSIVEYPRMIPYFDWFWCFAAGARVLQTKLVCAFGNLKISYTVVGLGKLLLYFSNRLLAWNDCRLWLGVHNLNNILCIAGPLLKENRTYLWQSLLCQSDDMGLWLWFRNINSIVKKNSQNIPPWQHFGFW